MSRPPGSPNKGWQEVEEDGRALIEKSAAMKKEAESKAKDELIKELKAENKELKRENRKNQ